MCSIPKYFNDHLVLSEHVIELLFCAATEETQVHGDIQILRKHERIDALEKGSRSIRELRARCLGTSNIILLLQIWRGIFASRGSSVLLFTLKGLLDISCHRYELFDCWSLAIRVIHLSFTQPVSLDCTFNLLSYLLTLQHCHSFTHPSLPGILISILGCQATKQIVPSNCGYLCFFYITRGRQFENKSAQFFAQNVVLQQQVCNLLDLLHGSFALLGNSIETDWLLKQL